MRADRLVAALLVLQARGRLTAAELADELEVSVRTARRDLEALQLAGVPVYAQRGRGGGWSLVGGARTDLTGLTVAEARALFLMAGPAASLAPDVRSALRKLVQALPEPFRDQATAAASAVTVDPAGWGKPVRTAAPSHLAVLQAAVVDRVQVHLDYADRTGARTQRTVHPLGLVDKGGAWYLLADTDAGQRTFRVDRITGVEPTDQPAVRPDGFDLEARWHQVVRDMEDRRTSVRAVVRAPRDAVPMLGAVFGADLLGVESAGEHTVEVVVGAARVEMLAWMLAGWGARVEVLEPPEVRHQLARIGSELVERYVRGGAAAGSSD